MDISTSSVHRFTWILLCPLILQITQKKIGYRFFILVLFHYHRLEEVQE